MNKNEYKEKRKDLLLNIHKESKRIIKDCNENLEEKIVNKLPFCGDGCVSPYVWFKSEFRPLFILKEPSSGEDNFDGFKQYCDKWQYKYDKEHKSIFFDMAEDSFDDVQIGVNKFNKTNNPWKRIIKLSYCLEQVHLCRKLYDYRKVKEIDFSYEQGDENKNSEKCDEWYKYKTKNKNYIENINKIAFLNIKKIVGGTKVSSEWSKKTLYFMEYIKDKELKELFCKQIKLLNPTITIFLGRDFNEKVFDDIFGDEFKHIYGYHPTRNKDEKFYKPVKDYYNMVKNKNY